MRTQAYLGTIIATDNKVVQIGIRNSNKIIDVPIDSNYPRLEFPNKGTDVGCVVFEEEKEGIVACYGVRRLPTGGVLHKIGSEGEQDFVINLGVSKSNFETAEKLLKKSTLVERLHYKPQPKPAPKKQ